MNNTQKKNSELLLAIDPMPRGFGFTLFEKPDSLVDWGITDIRMNINQRSLKRVKKLLEHYHPNRIVLENIEGKSSRRCKRIEQLIGKIIHMAKEKRIKVSQYSPKQVQDLFRQFKCHNKHDRAKAICKFLHRLSVMMPPKREIWMSEDPRTSLFDAVALALTHYYLED